MKPILLLVAAALLVQQEFAQEVTFKTETKLVVVNVSVKDKSGKPVTTLKKEDIEIYEDGVKQDLAVFELEQLSNDRARARRGHALRSRDSGGTCRLLRLPRGRP